MNLYYKALNIYLTTNSCMQKLFLKKRQIGTVRIIILIFVAYSVQHRDPLNALALSSMAFLKGNQNNSALFE